MLYSVRVVESAETTIAEIEDYLMYAVGGTGSFQAALNFRRELTRAFQKIRVGAESYALCEDEGLAELGVRKVHFRRQRYVVYYVVRGNEAVVIAIISTLRQGKLL